MFLFHGYEKYWKIRLPPKLGKQAIDFDQASAIKSKFTIQISSRRGSKFKIQYYSYPSM